VLAELLAKRARQERAWSNNIILLGDFNIFSPRDVAFDALTSAGFRVPAGLEQLPSNAAKNRHYDQIAFLNGSDVDQTFASGVLYYYLSVFRNRDEGLYRDLMGSRYEHGKLGRWRGKAGRRAYWRGWRTYQMSDHLVMWVGIDLN